MDSKGEQNKKQIEIEIILILKLLLSTILFIQLKNWKLLNVIQMRGNLSTMLIEMIIILFLV